MDAFVDIDIDLAGLEDNNSSYIDINDEAALLSLLQNTLHDFWLEDDAHTLDGFSVDAAMIEWFEAFMNQDEGAQYDKNQPAVLYGGEDEVITTGKRSGTPVDPASVAAYYDQLHNSIMLLAAQGFESMGEALDASMRARLDAIIQRLIDEGVADLPVDTPLDDPLTEEELCELAQQDYDTFLLVVFGASLDIGLNNPRDDPLGAMGALDDYTLFATAFREASERVREHCGTGD